MHLPQLQWPCLLVAFCPYNLVPQLQASCVTLRCACQQAGLAHARVLSGADRLLAGGLAGMASRAAVAPFERMRTMFMADRSQTTMKGVLQFAFLPYGIFACIRQLLALMNR